jgi:hypothetical protein
LETVAINGPDFTGNMKHKSATVTIPAAEFTGNRMTVQQHKLNFGVFG